MADRDGDNRERRRHRSRKAAAVIEMTAVDVTPPVEVVAAPAAETPAPELEAAAPQSEPPAPEPIIAAAPAEPPPPEPAPAKPDIIEPPMPLSPPPREKSYGLPLAAAGLIGALFGAAGGAIVPGLFGGAPAVDPQRVQRIEQGLAELSRRSAPPPATTETPALGQRMATIEIELKNRLAQLEQKVAAVPAPAAPPPPVNLAPLTDRVGALDRALAALDQKAEGLRAAATAEAAKVAESARAAADGLRTVEPQIRDLAARMGETVRRVDTTAAAPLYSAAESLRQALLRGAPFTAEVTALEALGAPAEQVARLKALAASGLPSAAQLQAGFQRLAMDVARAGQPAASGLQALIDGVVRTRATGQGAGDTPDGLVAEIEAALRRGDVTAALAAWAKLPEPSRKLSEAWAATARQREAALKAAAELQAAAIAALRKAAP